MSVGDIYDAANPSVVEITTSTSSATAQGSGFVYDADGHVVTNQHVVAGASEIFVRFSNGSSHPATLVGSDRSTDLAVLDVDAPDALLRALQLGNSRAVREGDAVVALGSPFGLEGTVTTGIVSALHRSMTAPNNFTIIDSIQTDAAINRGNSGGPLLDRAGHVIGVNAQIESESGGSNGVGFAIPSNTVRSIVAQIIETGSAEHAYLGVVGLATVEDGVAFEESRAGTPADEAGLEGATGDDEPGRCAGADGRRRDRRVRRRGGLDGGGSSRARSTESARATRCRWSCCGTATGARSRSRSGRALRSRELDG